MYLFFLKITKTGDDCVAISGGNYNINVTRVSCGPGHGIRYHLMLFTSLVKIADQKDLWRNCNIFRYIDYNRMYQKKLVMCHGLHSLRVTICTKIYGSIGSLGKNGSYTTVEKVLVRHCNITGTQNGLRIKTVPVRLYEIWLRLLFGDFSVINNHFS